MMENANEKKWFVYLTDHHEGPFSPQQLREMFESGRISNSSHAWCDGMADWTVIDQIASLSTITHPAPPPSQTGPSLTAAPAVQLTPVDTSLSEPSPVSTATDVKSEVKPESPEVKLESPLETKLEAAPSPAVAEPVLQSISPSTPISESGTASARIQAPAALEVKSESPTETAPPLTAAPAAAATTAPHDPFNDNHNPYEWTKTDIRQFTAGKDLPSPADLARKKRIRLGLVFLLLAAVLGFGYYGMKLKSPAAGAAWDTTLGFLAKIPGLNALLSPIPNLPDVNAEEMKELKNTAHASLKDGAQAAIALSQTDNASPRFYIGTNLPEDTQLEVIIVGVPDSLLNQTSFIEKIQASVKKHLATTAPLRASDGSQIPRGQYFVYVVESQAQAASVMNELSAVPVSKANLPSAVLNLVPGARTAKTFASKAFFLGGPKDESYAKRLTEFHEKLQEKAKQELAELGQFYSTLESQFTSSDSEFEKYWHGGKLTPAKTKEWKKFHDTFLALQSQLTQASEQWNGSSPEVFEKEYFYHSLYAYLQKLVAHVNQVHDLHHSYFTDAVDRAVFEEKLAQLSSDCAQVLGAFREKLEKAESTPPTPNGMPVREGL